MAGYKIFLLVLTNENNRPPHLKEALMGMQTSFICFDHEKRPHLKIGD